MSQLDSRLRRLVARAKGAGFDPYKEFHQLDMEGMMVAIADRLGVNVADDYIADDVLDPEIPLHKILVLG